MNIQIRQATTEDIGSIQKLNHELFVSDSKFSNLQMNWPLSEKGRKYFDEITKNANSICFVAQIDKRIIGYIIYSKKDSTCYAEKWGEIENMEISEEYRSQGIGSQLIDHVKNWAKKQGYEKLYVSAFYHNSRAVFFYKKNGFTEYDLGLSFDL